MVVAPPGPRCRALSERLRAAEAPGINTLYGGRPNVVWREALGANVLDADGNRYVDLTSGFGVAAVGHRHPAVTAAVRRQSGRLLHGLGDAAGHERRIELAERLGGLAPVGEPQVYFAVSGADAVEVAIKTAVLATGRSGVVAFEPAYHGVTLGALAATSRPEFRHPAAPHLHRHLCRLPFGCPPERIAGELDRGEPAACVIVEPIVGREGVIFPPAGWLADLARLAADRGTLLVADEIFTGFGRTGERFAVDAEGVRPDLLCCGKALGGGLPVAAVVGRRSLLAAWETPGEALHTGTFVAHPVACAAALATLEVIEGERLAERARALGDRVGDRLAGWPERFPALREVRGRGLLWGLELTSKTAAGALVDGARRRGILLLAGGPDGRVAQLVPPLTVAEGQLEVALGVLEETLAATEK
jgi:4-aminobutyrate aminotransferase-like enzyme